MEEIVKLYKFNHSEQEYALPHTHGTYELSYYIAGSGTVMIGGNIFKYGEKACVVVEKNCIHDDFAETAQTVFCLRFNTEMPLVSGVVDINDGNRHIVNQIEDILLKLYENKEKKESNFDEKSYFARLIVCITRIFEDKKNMKGLYKIAVVNYVKNYLNDNIHCKINFEILSDKIGYSYDRVRKIFKEIEKVSLYKYLTNIRFAKAKKLLFESNNVSIKKIARECGFASVVRFNLFFREHMDLSPREYRKVVRSKYEYDVYKKQ